MTNAASSAETTNDGNHQTNVKVSQVFFLRAIIYYIKDGDNVFKEAAEFLQERLEAQFPAAENNKVALFHITTPDDFKNVWNEINTLSRDGKHILKRLHFLGHGGERAIYCLGDSLRFDDVKDLPELNWDADSIFVIHACRTGHEYETNKGDKVYCIAREFSKKQKTRVLGQMVGANFSLKKEIRSYALFSKRQAYLWAYCSGRKTKNFVLTPKSVGENLYEEYKQLSYKVKETPRSIDDSMSYDEIMKEIEQTGYFYVPSGKLWACQTFRDGQALPRDLNDVGTDLYFM